MDSAVHRGAKIAFLLVTRDTLGVGKEAALASLCAAKYGKFSAMHSRLMFTDGWQNDPNWVFEAESAGVVNVDGFQACFENGEMVPTLDRHSSLVRELGITGTPTFVSPSTVEKGAVDAMTIMSMVSE